MEKITAPTNLPSKRLIRSSTVPHSSQIPTFGVDFTQKAKFKVDVNPSSEKCNLKLSDPIMSTALHPPEFHSTDAFMKRFGKTTSTSSDISTRTSPLISRKTNFGKVFIPKRSTCFGEGRSMHNLRSQTINENQTLHSSMESVNTNLSHASSRNSYVSSDCLQNPIYGTKPGINRIRYATTTNLVPEPTTDRSEHRTQTNSFLLHQDPRDSNCLSHNYMPTQFQPNVLIENLTEPAVITNFTQALPLTHQTLSDFPNFLNYLPTNQQQYTDYNQTNPLTNQHPFINTQQTNQQQLSNSLTNQKTVNFAPSAFAVIAQDPSALQALLSGDLGGRSYIIQPIDASSFNLQNIAPVSNYTQTFPQQNLQQPVSTTSSFRNQQIQTFESTTDNLAFQNQTSDQLVESTITNLSCVGLSDSSQFINPKSSVCDSSLITNNSGINTTNFKNHNNSKENSSINTIIKGIEKSPNKTDISLPTRELNQGKLVQYQTNLAKVNDLDINKTKVCTLKSNNSNINTKWNPKKIIIDKKSVSWPEKNPKELESYKPIRRVPQKLQTPSFLQTQLESVKPFEFTKIISPKTFEPSIPSLSKNKNINKSSIQLSQSLTKQSSSEAGFPKDSSIVSVADRARLWAKEGKQENNIVHDLSNSTHLVDKNAQNCKEHCVVKNHVKDFNTGKGVENNGISKNRSDKKFVEDKAHRLRAQFISTKCFPKVSETGKNDCKPVRFSVQGIQPSLSNAPLEQLEDKSLFTPNQLLTSVPESPRVIFGDQLTKLSVKEKGYLFNHHPLTGKSVKLERLAQRRKTQPISFDDIARANQSILQSLESPLGSFKDEDWELGSICSSPAASVMSEFAENNCPQSPKPTVRIF